MMVGYDLIRKGKPDANARAQENGAFKFEGGPEVIWATKTKARAI